MRTTRDARPRRRLPLQLLPWAAYIGLTILAPAVNGAARDEKFVEHAVITLGASGAVLMLWLAVAMGHGRRNAREARGGFARDRASAASASRGSISDRVLPPTNSGVTQGRGGE